MGRDPAEMQKNNMWPVNDSISLCKTLFSYCITYACASCSEAAAAEEAALSDQRCVARRLLRSETR